MYKLTRNTENRFSIHADSLYDIFNYIAPLVDKKQNYSPETLDIPGHKGGLSIEYMLHHAKGTTDCVNILLNCHQLKGKFTLTEEID